MTYSRFSIVFFVYFMCALGLGRNVTSNLEDCITCNDRFTSCKVGNRQSNITVSCPCFIEYAECLRETVHCYEHDSLQRMCMDHECTLRQCAMLGDDDRSTKNRFYTTIISALFSIAVCIDFFVVCYLLQDMIRESIRLNRINQV
jgi:hypothetical protein